MLLIFLSVRDFASGAVATQTRVRERHTRGRRVWCENSWQNICCAPFAIAIASDWCGGSVFCNVCRLGALRYTGSENSNLHLEAKKKHTHTKHKGAPLIGIASGAVKVKICRSITTSHLSGRCEKTTCICHKHTVFATVHATVLCLTHKGSDRKRQNSKKMYTESHGAAAVLSPQIYVESARPCLVLGKTEIKESVDARNSRLSYYIYKSLKYVCSIAHNRYAAQVHFYLISHTTHDTDLLGVWAGSVRICANGRDDAIRSSAASG